ncbi:MAG: hypothetical protein ACXWNQ_01450 [Anaerolineales bacterium]
MAVVERKRVWKKKRPVAVTVVAWGIVVLFLIRLYQVYILLMGLHVLESGITSPLYNGLRLTSLGSAVVLSGSYLLQVLVGIVALIGFLRLQRWAWVLLMAWTGFSLCISLINYFYSRPNYIVMASDVIIAFALSQSDVQRIFHIRMDPNEPPG